MSPEHDLGCPPGNIFALFAQCRQTTVATARGVGRHRGVMKAIARSLGVTVSTFSAGGGQLGTVQPGTRLL